MSQKVSELELASEGVEVVPSTKFESCSLWEVENFCEQTSGSFRENPVLNTTDSFGDNADGEGGDHVPES